MALIDTHTHLFLEQFDADIQDVLERARFNGVEKLFLPNIDSSTIDRMLELCETNPEMCFPMMGLHPCSVKDNFEEELQKVEEWLKKGQFYAIGETGLDLYWDKTFLDQQIISLKKHIEWAKEYGLPIVLHVRDSFDEIFKVVDELNDDALTGIFHCFSGTLEQAEHIISYGGFKLGIGGVATFKNGGLDKVLPHIELGHLVLETDSPYLAPVPYRGKRNESGYIKLVAERVAELKQISLAEVENVTTQNAQDIFKL